jgi:hypothetical protein
MEASTEDSSQSTKNQVDTVAQTVIILPETAAEVVNVDAETMLVGKRDDTVLESDRVSLKPSTYISENLIDFWMSWIARKESKSMSSVPQLILLPLYCHKEWLDIFSKKITDHCTHGLSFVITGNH